MPPNAMDTVDVDAGERGNGSKAANAGPRFTSENNDNYGLKIFQSSLNLLAHILIGATVGVTLFFAFLIDDLPLGPTPLHIVLCVLGYQLLMAQAILSLCPHNGWSANLRLFDKKVAHTVLQVAGSVLAIAGSFIKMLDKTVNFNTLHGQFGLVALVFTSVSLVNGIASFYAYNLRKCLPGSLSKITHVCFGTVAFSAANICLCYGFDKNFFKTQMTSEFTYTLMAFTACFTFIIIINPLITFFNKTSRALKCK